MPVLTQAKQLKKELTLFHVFTLATGATLSSGFFLLPGIAAQEAKSAVVLAYLLAIVPLFPGILSKIELATAMPRAGGEYYFIDRSMGPLLGTIGGMGTWCGLMLKTSFAMIGMAVYLELFFDHLPIKPILAALTIFFGVLNLFGAHKSGVLQTLLVFGLLILLVWFTASGVTHLKSDYLAGMTRQPITSIFVAAGMVCVSFMGLTKVASVAEEIKDAERNLPLGIFLAMGVSMLIYGLGTLVIVGVTPPNELIPADGPNLTPVASAAENMIGHTGAVVMTVAAILAFLSVANAGILSASRYPLAMSRDHLLPKWLSALNRFRSPHSAIVLTICVVLLFVTVFDATKIAKLASAFLLLLFAFNCLSVIVMRESKIDSYDPGFRSPFYPWTQIVGVIGPMVFIIIMGWLPILFCLGVITFGSLWYFYYARHRVNRGGAIYHLFARLGQRRYEGLDRELRSILKEKGLRAEDPYDEVVACAPFVDAAPAANFEQVVHQASEKLAVHLPLSAEQLTELFMEGTRVGATPVSKGVALPHARLPGLDMPLMILARTAGGVHVDVKVDFVEHASEQAIYAVIFLISPEENASQHLRILAQVAQHVDDQRFIEEWLAAKSEQRIKEILLHDERYCSLRLKRSGPTETLIDRAVRQLDLPDDSLIAMIHRGDEVIVPRGDTVLNENDQLMIVGLPKSIQQIQTKYQPPVA